LQDWTIDSSIFNETSETSDTLKVQHFGPLNDLTLERQDPGRGHSFSDLSLSNPTWCDKCGDFMWGFLTAAVKCDNCNYTCHEKCKSLVTLDCKTYESTVKSTSSEDSTFKKVPSLYPNLQVVESEESVAPLGAEKAPIFQESDSDKKCVGFIQIHMNFTRPINVVAGETFPSVFDVSGTASNALNIVLRTISSFFLPRNTVKTVNISKMIVTLLRKFKVADNPRKFSLYERTCETNEENTGGNELVRVPDDAYPLRIAHSWMKLNLHKQFVLQENDTGDILWEMFEVPELENFLRILAIEEKQYLFRIRQKYRSYIEQFFGKDY
uniref:Ras association domain-containing protein 1 n=1 Tax=Syphacia muris TaxID=451379 RepID=A0A0N5AQ60_9BILA